MGRNRFFELGAATVLAAVLVGAGGVAAATNDLGELDEAAPQSGEGNPAATLVEEVEPADAAVEGVDADVETSEATNTVTNEAICTEYLDEHSGVVTIDVSAFAGFDTLVVGEGGAVPCAAQVTELVFLGQGPTRLIIRDRILHQENQDGDTWLTKVVFPSGLVDLTIEEEAFYQDAYGTGSDTLAIVSFPEGLQNLTIGDRAFFQRSRRASNALTQITFPSGLTNLTVGHQSLFQSTLGGDNALADVVFPSGLKHLKVGIGAFRQAALSGATALERVTFPDGLETLDLELQAFYQQAATAEGNALWRVDFPADLTALTLGHDAFGLETNSGSNLGPVPVMYFAFGKTGVPKTVSLDYATKTGAPWVWLGEDGAITQYVWSTGWGPRYELRGPRVASFDGNGGTVIGGGQDLYVFPDVGGLAQVTYADDLIGLNPDGFADPGSRYLVPLPGAFRDGFFFAGWEYGGALYQPNDHFALPHSKGTLVAKWQAFIGGPGSPEGASGSSSVGGKLAKTGVDVVPWAFTGISLLAVGAALAVIGRAGERKRIR